MYKLEITSDAESDMDKIWDYIAQDNPTGATDFILKILDKCELLTTQPYMGSARDEIRKGLRMTTVGDSDYIILYRVKGEAVEIQHIFNGKQDYQGHFG